MRRHSARKFQVYDPAPSEQPSGRLGHDAPAEDLDVLRGSKIPRWKRWNVSAKQPGVLQFIRRRRKKTQEFTLNLEGAKVAEHLEHPRQFSVITASRTCYLRVKDREKRGYWVKAIQESIDSLTNAVDKLRTSLRPTGGTPQSSLSSISRKLTQELARAADDPGIERRAQARAARRWQDIQGATPNIEQELGGLSAAGGPVPPATPGREMDMGFQQQQPPRSRLSQTSGADYPAQPAQPYGGGVQGQAPGVPSGLQEHHLAAHNLQMPPEGGPFLQEGLVQSGPNMWMRPSSPSRLQNLRSDRPVLRMDSMDSFRTANQELPSEGGSADLDDFQDAPSTLRPSQQPMRPQNAWQAHAQAVQAALFDQEMHAVELELENRALKSSLREYKTRARTFRHHAASAGGSIPEAVESSSDDEPAELDTPADDASDAGEDDAAARQEHQAHSAKAQELLQALNIVNAHNYIVRQEPDGSTTTPERLSETSQPMYDAQPSDVDADSSGSDDGESAISQHASPESMSRDNWRAANSRTRLPAPRPLQRGFSIWSVLKNAIGKDLSRITLPATINEPTSAVQRITEDLEYMDLLRKALHSQSSTERLMYVSVFAVSGYSNTLYRESKPFNPLLGETFEWQSADGDTRFLCEQVSHHPPISCWWSEGAQGGFKYSGELEMRSKFWGKSVELIPTGTCWLQLPGSGDLYSWEKVTCQINNLIMGKYWLEWHGSVTIKNHTTGESAEVKLAKCGGKQEKRGELSGTVKDAQGHTAWTISGSYMGSISASEGKGGGAGQVVYQCTPLPADAEEQYNMTGMALSLNNPHPGLLRELPPTDSRLRPDQRELELGHTEEATSEKLRLEEKQRETRRIRKEAGEEYAPLWFEMRGTPDGKDLIRTMKHNDGKQGPMWHFTGAYWQSKQASDWSRCPDVYSKDA